MTSAHCRNVSRQQQFFSELPSPGRSRYTNSCYNHGIKKVTNWQTSYDHFLSIASYHANDITCYFCEPHVLLSIYNQHVRIRLFRKLKKKVGVASELQQIAENLN